MGIELLSKIQFAATAGFHFLFVPLTLGLSSLVAFMETRYAITGQEKYLRMTKYWSRLFIVNFAVGVVTGITMEFQFGMNWAEYSKFVGDIFGAPLAIEATVAFFLESTFLGLWLFSWKKVSKGAHAVIMWMVAFASSLSAIWILLANGWMQNPVGFAINNGRAELTSFWALIGNPYGWVKLFHTLSAAFTLSAFFIMGISAIRLLKNKEDEVYRSSFRIGATVAIFATVLVIIAGDLSGKEVAKVQPAKFAAMESLWETGSNVSFNFIQIPDEAGQRNSVEALKVPGLTSWLATWDANAKITGLKDIPPQNRPGVWVNLITFRTMVGLGFLFALLALIAVIFAWRNTLTNHRGFLRIMAIAMFLPYLAVEMGWMLAELGRQPWIVNGLMRTVDGVSKNLGPVELLISLIGFVLIYGTLAVVDVTLLAKYAKKSEA